MTGEDGMTLEVCAGIVDKSSSFKAHVVAEVAEETGYAISEERLELVKCYVGAVGIAGVHSRVYYVEVTNADVSYLNYFLFSVYLFNIYLLNIVYLFF